MAPISTSLSMSIAAAADADKLPNLKNSAAAVAKHHPGSHESTDTPIIDQHRQPS
jgi:hypothetical protein